MRVIDPAYVFEDDDGNPLSGGRVYFYTSGTATLKATYSDISRTVQNANPLTISADGRLSVDVFGNGSYRVRVADANGSTIWTEDDVSLSQIILPSYTTATRPSSHGTVPSLIYDSTLGKTMMWNGSAWVDTFGAELPSEATLRADLASTASTSYGASLVAYKRIGDTGAVATTVYSKLRDVVSVKDFGAVGDGVTDDTAAIQAAMDSGSNNVIFPAGTYLHGPVDVDSSVRLLFDAGAVVSPSFAASGTEKLYNVTADSVVIDGLTVTSETGTISGNKYIVYAGAGGDSLRVLRASISGVTASDGNLGASNLIVVHGVYAESVADLVVDDCRVDGISGSAVFLKSVSSAQITRNHITDTGWYSINADHTNTDIVIADNIIDGDDVNARYYGGSINLMSQTTGTKNKRVTVRGNRITGVHNYGAAIRVLSIEDCVIEGNSIFDCVNGSLGADDIIQYIGIDRRGTAEGAAENGPCRNVTIAHNVLRAGTGSHIGIYVKNQYKATRDPHENIVIAHNNVFSPSSSAAFEQGVSLHGHKSGISGVRIESNLVDALTVSGSAVGGVFGVVSTNSDGAVEGLTIEGNRIVDINTSVPSSSYQTGIYIQATTSYPRVQNNEIVNFYYGLRTAASLTSPKGLNEQTFIDCVNDVLYGTAPTGGSFDMSLGTALPVTGVYRVGHVLQKTDAAASASWGWIVTTAGGAMTAAWSSGATYTAGNWYRNASGRVYELITAGGGTTSVEPSGTTVGADETGADGYVWRCRSTTSARWATLPALGAVAALP